VTEGRSSPGHAARSLNASRHSEEFEATKALEQPEVEMVDKHTLATARSLCSIADLPAVTRMSAENR
jgi:hypothetical protein